MVRYKAITFSNIRFDDYMTVELLVGEPVEGRLRYIEPLHENAAKKECEWYNKVLLQVIPKVTND